MRRATASRLTLTIDNELLEFLDSYAWDHRCTKSDLITMFIEALKEGQDAKRTDQVYEEVRKDPEIAAGPAAGGVQSNLPVLRGSNIE